MNTNANPAGLVKPRACRRCDGVGFIAAMMHVNMGRCLACDGAGEVETDRATLEARAAYTVARTALGAAAFAHSHAAHSGLGILEVDDPARCRKAVESFAAGRTDVLSALVAYFAERAAE